MRTRRRVVWFALAALVLLGVGLGAQELIAQGAVKAAKQITVYSTALTFTVVAANTTGERTGTVPGLRVGDHVSVNKPTVQTGLGLCGSRVSAANTIAICFINATAAVITPTAAQVYTILGTRP